MLELLVLQKEDRGRGDSKVKLEMGIGFFHLNLQP